jgi:hypothetical protein
MSEDETYSSIMYDEPRVIDTQPIDNNLDQHAKYTALANRISNLENQVFELRRLLYSRQFMQRSMSYEEPDSK